MFTNIICILVGVLFGFFIFRKNPAKATAITDKAEDLAKKL